MLILPSSTADGFGNCSGLGRTSGGVMTAPQRPTRAGSAPSIAFCWDVLPQYAARLIKAAIDRLGRECIVIGSRPTVPIEGMEKVLAQRVHWVDSQSPLRWRDLGLEAPDILIQAGWSYPHFTALGREIRAR